MTKWIATHPENLDLAFDLGHASRGVDISSSDQLYGDLFPPLHMETEFYLTKLTLSQGLQQQIGTKLGNGTAGMGGSVGHGCRVRVDVAIYRNVVIWDLVWLLLRRLHGVGRPFS